MNSSEWGNTVRKRKLSLDRTVLRDQIREYLVDAILDGEYNAGDRIVETRVAQQLGVSQGAVREALRELEWMGFLETQPFSGTYVKDLSAVRAALEELGARLATPRLSDEQLIELERMVDMMIEVSEQGDTRRMVEINYAFHRTIMEASGNSVLSHSWSMFQFSYWTTISTAALYNELVYLAQRHIAILDALKARDPERAAQTMRDHIIELIGLVGSHRHPDE